MLKAFRLGPASLGARLRRVLGGLGLGLLSTTPAVAQVPAGQPVPGHWLSYAQSVSLAFEDRLGNQASETVQRLHAWLQQHLLQSPQTRPEAPALVVRLWVAPQGQIERLEFDSLGQAQADADLRQLLASDPLPTPPPRDMRQPLVLQLSLAVGA